MLSHENLTSRKAKTILFTRLNLLMKYPVNIETCWIIGLWSADRGALAKGVVAIVNTTPELLEKFHDLSLKNFDITESKFRSRIIRGYGESKEVYFTRLPVRCFIENLIPN